MEAKEHKTIRKQFMSYLEGSISPKDRETVDAHIRECQDCRAFLEELQVSLALLDENKEMQTSGYFYAGVKNKLQAASPMGFVPGRFLQPALFVLLLLVGIRFGIWVGAHVENSAPQTEQAELLPFDDLTQEPIEDFLLNLK